MDSMVFVWVRFRSKSFRHAIGNPHDAYTAPGVLLMCIASVNIRI